MIVLLVITDGRREYLTRTIPSALANLTGPITRRVIFDDSGDQDHHDWLADQFPTFDRVWHPDGRQGFGGAIRQAWRHLAASDERFVFHLEDDFTFNDTVDLAGMAQLLQAHPHLVQVALRRQPWNDAERHAGGVVERTPNLFEDHQLGKYAWLEHRQFWTTNPSLYRRTLCLAAGWPHGKNSEGRFTHHLLRHGSPEVDGERLRFAYWGARDSGEAVEHIGHERIGCTY
jgi:hypothetical protein